MTEGTGITVKGAVARLALTVCAGVPTDAPISGAVVSDLLSYVMAHGKRGDVWVTIQTHSNIVAVAALAGMAAVVIADGNEPAEDTLGRAEEEGIVLLRSEEAAFTLAGRLWESGVR
jgi:hypothetical protein